MARITKRVSETKKHRFKNGVDSPCLATSHTNDKAHLNRAHDEQSKNNDNKVIWEGAATEGKPLFQYTTARCCHKNTKPRKCHEPCGYWELYTHLRKKINNNICLSCLFRVRKPHNLGTSDRSWYAYMSLKFKTIAKLNEMLNTMNMASVLQGKNPPPLVNDLHYIWNMSWRWIIHWTVLYWHLNWKERSHPPYCFKV